jgi:hypothetical protein
VAQLRDHMETLIRQESPAAPLSMVFYVECLASRFSGLDHAARQLNLALVSEVFGWFGENSAGCWPALLQPSKSVLHAAMGDEAPEVARAAFAMVRASWEWSPPDELSPAERKRLGTWKAELHARCVELFQSRDPDVRAAAGLTVVSVPIEAQASRGLVLLHDASPTVRRAMLLALEPRPQLLASEDVVKFLRDPAASVRSAADLVLTNRGLSREQITLASRATDPSPLVRAQALRHIVESTVVDRAVWLTHLSRDSESTVRGEAARALAEVGDDDCRTRLTEMADSDPDPQVRQLAVELARGSSRSRRPASDAADAITESLPPLRTPKAN